ncbi:tetratricopeptide repeat protein [Nibricoccus sp. IMCC34717]|uniref:tetratricopeptide repeat protein n=1 Tax=Nibricoccus sp. IMCC34717 TaxID=3034021 RepID=UPI00384FE873
MRPPHFPFLPFLPFLSLLSFLSLLPSAHASDSLAERRLKEIVADQRTVVSEALAPGAQANDNEVYNQLQAICRRYDALIADNPDFAPAYVAYGLLLGQVGMKKESAGMLLRANKIDSNLPLVKNQLGNLVAEAGKPLDALNYYLAAIDLDPREPLYHFQLGNLLAEARDDFLQAGGKWTRETLDETMLRAFRTASELAPADWRYAYRYGLAFYDLEKPRWDDALALWQRLEPRLDQPVEQQICRLHQAKVLLELGHRDEALGLLDTVTEPTLQAQKTKLLAPAAAPANP